MERASPEGAGSLTPSVSHCLGWSFAGVEAKLVIPNLAQYFAKRSRMQIKLASIMVDDQEKALLFYTNVLGFTKKADNLMGSFRWLTVTLPEGAEGVELVLEPMHFPPSQAYQKALFDAGIPPRRFSAAIFTASMLASRPRGSSSVVSLPIWGR